MSRATTKQEEYLQMGFELREQGYPWKMIDKKFKKEIPNPTLRTNLIKEIEHKFYTRNGQKLTPKQVTTIRVQKRTEFATKSAKSILVLLGIVFALIGFHSLNRYGSNIWFTISTIIQVGVLLGTIIITTKSKNLQFLQFGLLITAILCLLEFVAGIPDNMPIYSIEAKRVFFVVSIISSFTQWMYIAVKLIVTIKCIQLFLDFKKWNDIPSTDKQFMTTERKSFKENENLLDNPIV